VPNAVHRAGLSLDPSAPIAFHTADKAVEAVLPALIFKLSHPFDGMSKKSED
jgi:hypothetical protein